MIGNHVHDNMIVQTGNDPSDPGNWAVFALGWLEDDEWGGGVMFDLASDNRGADNVYGYPEPEDPGKYRFEWAYTPTESLAAFNATPGEENGRYLSDVEKDQALLAVGIPLWPEVRQEAVVGKSASQIPKDYVPTQGIADRRDPELEAKGSETLCNPQIRVVDAVMAGGQ